ncbi:Gfo/Idh/MocA family protein [Echinicola vietnamensis]|uniref:Putative dehydrogenase n=1 Tax=Echinicola vietnamensis (strain DSM 17526 / LMG 23754 / KMM 6221) TaxID=926556 RepID=L0G0I4_ECHVK|nr:Gfo/Idh/MocA family oxidoreductase [Echinicola vietnamensis]AGA79042.1 putative dehydrogenase [Echinicola vietnamensis DSM 17526]
MKRRQFIQRTALATAAINFPNVSFGRKKEKLGVALVGLGGYSTGQLAPALQMTANCHLAGIVTGTPAKAVKWQKDYGIPDQNIYNYDNFESIADNPDIDVVYVVLPNSMHTEYAIKAAEAGKHVWCEKPMAKTVKECEQIIEACRKNKVKLSIGYRMQHEPNTQLFREFVKTQKYGELKMLEAVAGFYMNSTGIWRLDKEMGGGAMYDMGVYPINGVRYISGQEPISVMAYESKMRPEMFAEVDETMNYMLEFPDGLMANCATSFGMNMGRLTVTCRSGNFRLEPFQSYGGIKGYASDGTQFTNQVKSQQAVQMDDDAMAILQDKPVMVPGEEGLRDVMVVEAAFKSAKEGVRVKIG